MDINYFMKVQNAYGTKNRREKELSKVNGQMEKHFEDTYDTEEVLLNGEPFKLMIIKDTDGNTYKKKIKAPHDTKFNLGDYVEWNGQMWLITLLDTDDKTWNRGYMYQCTILLRWQNSKGEIIERWAYSEDFTKYSTGVKSNSTLTVGDYQYGLTLPVDEETKFVKRDKRFPIDFEDVEPPDVYKLTNRKILLAATDNRPFGRGGILIWTLSFSEFNSDTDKKVILPNGTQAWICDYNNHSSTSSPDTSNYSIKIEYSGNPTVVAGSQGKVFSARIYDAHEDEINSPVSWQLTCLKENEDYVSSEILENNSIRIKSKYSQDIIGTKVLLQAIYQNKTEQLYVTIGGGI